MSDSLDDFFPAAASASAPIGPLASEGSLRRAAAFSPAEQAASDSFERSPGNLRELRRSIAAEKRPEARALLEAELAKQTRTRPAANEDTLDSFFPPPPPQTETQRTLGGIAAGGKAVARAVSDFGDMMLSIPGMAVGSAADVASRVQSLLEGTDSKTAGRVAQGVRRGVTETFSPTPFRQLTEMAIKAVSPDENDVAPSDVQKGMQTISEGLEKGGKWVEKKTGGVITAETFDSLVNEAMALGGVKGAAAGMKSLTPKEKPPGTIGEQPSEPTVEPPSASYTDPNGTTFYSDGKGNVYTSWPPPSARAARDAKADIAASTGVADTRAALADREARRDQARAAFTEDPQYADYLRNYAEEEARLRTVQPPDVTAPGTPASPLPRTARTGARGAVEEQQRPPAIAPAVETGGPSSLDSGIAKIKDGRAFDLTAEERIAVRGAASEWGRPQLLDENGKPLPRQGGKADVDLLRLISAAGLGTAAAVYALRGDEGDRQLAVAAGGALTLARLGKMPDTSPLGSMLEQLSHGAKTLDRLPQGHFKITREQLMQQLNRADVSKAEKDIFLGIMGDKSEITAKELLGGFKMRTGDFELKAQHTDEYADYGLDAIGRSQTLGARDPDVWAMMTPEGRAAAEAAGETPSRTTVYQSPIALGEANHFSDPNYFGHTRSFDEGGIRHVVEVQSDLAQKAGKELKPEEKAALEAEKATIDRIGPAAKQAHNVVNDSRSTVNDYVAALDKLEAAYDPSVLLDVKLRIGKRIADEYYHSGADTDPAVSRLFSSFASDGRFDEVYNYTKKVYEKASTDRRIDRSNISALSSALEVALYRESRRLTLRADEIDAKLGEQNVSAVRPMLKDWPKRLVREELAQVGDEVARKQALAKTYRDMGDAESRMRAAELENAVDVPVRFATADTVAKVEGWPDRAEAYRQTYEGSGEERAGLVKPPEQRFSSEHQSIYDRYSRDIEKFLSKDLGGKPYTDPQGHTWIEVPLPKRPTTGRQGGPTQMFGKADPNLLARLAALGLGATAGVALDPDNPITAGLLGALGGAAVAAISPRKVAATIRNLASKDTRVSISGLANDHETATRLAAIDTINLQKRIETLVPDKARREAISHALEAGETKGLSAKEIEAAKLARQFLDELGAGGFDAGILKGFLENYVTHIWDFKPEQRGLIDAWLERTGGTGMSPKSPYAKARTIPSIAEGKAMGLKPVSEDISTILGIYSNSMVRAIENAKLIDALKRAKDPNGAEMIMAADKAPRSFVGVEHPQFRGLRVHPDLAPQLEFLFDTGSSSAAMRVLQGINDTTKRAAVSFSLFHAKALADALIGGSSGWIFSLSKIPGFVRGTDKFLQEVKKGSASPLVVDAVKSGLMFSTEKAASAVEDVGAGFYKSMEALQRVADKAIPFGGKAVEGVTKINHTLDKFMWSRLHAGMKLSVWAEKRDRLLLNSAKRHASDPNVRVLSKEEAGTIAASYANDLFGGLNWRKIAMDAETRFGRSLGEALLKPSSRRVAQLAVFAPDWTLSTTRAVTQALGKDLLDPRQWANVARGLRRPTELRDLHRQYILRSALYYFVVGNAINYAASGHYLWENKDKNKNMDWTMIDLGDGRRMQWSKHTMEPVHWVTKPSQQALNKLGFLPRETLNQVLHTEYLSPRTDKAGNVTAGPAMKENRLAHAAKALTPIALQQGIGGDPSTMSALAGFAGAPIYGMTAEQKAMAREQRRRQQTLEGSRHGSR